MKIGKYKVLMQEMADLTSPECATVCRVPHSCCDSLYCEITKQYAQDTFQITIEPTEHPTLPFMGPKGCIVEPYLRPMCTFHTCDVNGVGMKKGDLAWTENYFALRENLDVLIGELEVTAPNKVG